MTSRSVNGNFISRLILMPLLFAGTITGVNAAENHNISLASHRYASYAEFAHSACLPCHYRGIANGTDLAGFFSSMSEPELKSYLTAMLKHGNMPPDKIYREILFFKFLAIK